MNRFLTAFLMLGLLLHGPGAGAAEAEDAESHGVVHTVLLYLPNRVLDLLDVVRLRVRVGPGLAVNARATELAAVFAGSYASVYAGLPGPRNRPLPKLPAGVETRTGVQASVADASVSGGFGPDYGPAEFGLGTQLFIIGFDAGVDPWELLDFVTGFVCVDLRHDDL